MNKYFNMVEIEVNSNCNRTCWYCPNSIAQRKETGEMDPEVFLELMKQLKSIDFNGRISYHFYGEPLLCSNLEIFIETSKKYLPNAKNVIYTNGDYLTLEKLILLINLGVDRFIVTNHVGPKSPFSKVVEMIPEKYKNKVIYNDHSQLVLSNRGGILKEKIKERSISKNMSCFVPSTLIIVTLKGNVLPCFEDFYQTKVMGNILENHIKDIWDSETYIKFREDLRSGQRCTAGICESCNNFSVQSEEMYEYVL